MARLYTPGRQKFKVFGDVAETVEVSKHRVANRIQKGDSYAKLLSLNKKKSQKSGGALIGFAVAYLIRLNLW